MWETITVYIKYSHVDLLVLMEYEWQSLVKSLLQLSTLFIWGIPDTERRGACMCVGHTCFLKNSSPLWWQIGFLRLHRYHSKVTKVIFHSGEDDNAFLLPAFWNRRTSPDLEKKPETKRFALYHRVTPHSHKPHLLQSAHTFTSFTLNPPILSAALK